MEDPLERVTSEIAKLREELEALRTRVNAPPPPKLPPLPPRPALFGGRGGAGPTPVQDTMTNTVYGSKYQAGLAFSGEFPGTDPRYLYYKLVAKYPGRFVSV